MIYHYNDALLNISHGLTGTRPGTSITLYLHVGGTKGRTLILPSHYATANISIYTEFAYTNDVTSARRRCRFLGIFPKFF